MKKCFALLLALSCAVSLVSPLSALAEELIDGRELTKDEREKYHLVH